jgi:hypothetical protein
LEVHLLNKDIIVYISAASDLPQERELLGRMATEIPLDFGWRIVLSPIGDGLLDVQSIQLADMHFLLLGGDIRAPIGQEWIIAKQAGRHPFLYSKQGILRTNAALDFYRYIQSQAMWKPFSDSRTLRKTALLDISGRILDNALQYGLSLPDLENLQTWREQINTEQQTFDELAQSGTGSSSLILSPEAIASKGGIIIGNDPGERKDE